MTPELLPEEIDFYARQLILPDWGSKPQRILKSTSILIPDSFEIAGRYLAGAGIGELVLFPTSSERESAKMLADDLRLLNPYIKVAVYEAEPTNQDFSSFCSERIQKTFAFPIGKIHFCFTSFAENLKIERSDSEQLRSSISVVRPRLAGSLPTEFVDSILASAYVIKALGRPE